MSRICFFGAYDPAYPRNAIVRAGLAHAGYEVTEARVPEKRAVFRYPILLAAFAKAARDADVLWVPEFRHKDVPLASWLKGRRLLVFDPLVSRHDTLVGDWALHAPGSGQARWNRMIDRWSFSKPDLILCDTWAHGALFESLGAPRHRLRRVLVGAEREFFQVGPPPDGGPVRVLYVGGFLPLHGVPCVVEALALLERDASRLPEFEVVMVGKGIEFERSRARARELGLARVEFTGSKPYSEAPREFARAHVVLGAFGSTEKAGRVVPHKVYQGLAAGRAVVTGAGAGPSEVLTGGVHAALVPRGNPAALAEALRELISDPERRAALGARGRALALEVATPERIGESVRQALERTA